MSVRYYNYRFRAWVVRRADHKTFTRAVVLKLHLSPAISSTVSFIIAFAVITFLHVVIGELAPKTFAIQRAEQVSLLLSKPLIYFTELCIRLFGL